MQNGRIISIIEFIVCSNEWLTLSLNYQQKCSLLWTLTIFEVNSNTVGSFCSLFVALHFLVNLLPPLRLLTLWRGTSCQRSLELSLSPSTSPVPHTYNQFSISNSLWLHCPNPSKPISSRDTKTAFKLASWHPFLLHSVLLTAVSMTV